jgi:hypothetical protein
MTDSQAHRARGRSYSETRALAPSPRRRRNPAQHIRDAIEPRAIYGDVVDGRLQLEKPAAVVQRDDADLPPATSPPVGKRSNDTLDASGVQAVADKDEIGREINTPRHDNSG